MQCFVESHFSRVCFWIKFLITFAGKENVKPNSNEVTNKPYVVRKKRFCIVVVVVVAVVGDPTSEWQGL